MDNARGSCSFTGHRISKLPWGNDEGDSRCIALKEKLFAVTEAVYFSGVRHFICGMANGCDLYFAETVLELKKERPDIILEAAVPYPGQADSWGQSLKDRYESLLSRCDKKTVVQEFFTRDCMMRRNRYMVDNSSVLIACYDGKPGGTMNTLLYALRQKVEIIEVPVE